MSICLFLFYMISYRQKKIHSNKKLFRCHNSEVLLRSELYHKSLYYTSCARCGNRFLYALLFIGDNLSNITLY